MKRALFLSAFCLALVGYGLFFQAQEKAFTREYTLLKFIPPAPVMRILAGYGRHLAAEMAFIQNSVFLGGLPSGSDPLTYGHTLAHNYKTIAQMYPEFSDTYLYAQSYLAQTGEEGARAAIDILDYGRKAYPENVLYAFFQGFDWFSYLDEPKKAAAIYEEASKISEASKAFFERLALLMRADGGELEATLASMEILARTTDDVALRKQYEDEGNMVKQAMEVQKAASLFAARNMRHPETLEELVPGYIAALPDFGYDFKLVWRAPNVGLKRLTSREVKAKRAAEARKKAAEADAN